MLTSSRLNEKSVAEKFYDGRPQAQVNISRQSHVYPKNTARHWTIQSSGLICPV
jgi:hypothetical protein